MSATSEPAEILIVDDTPANLTVLSAILSRQGYRVRAAPNGAGGLRTSRRTPPDLVLLDIQMPDMNGYEVCRQLKDDPATRHVPVIFISALDSGLDKVEAFRVGGADYIAKPFQIEEVLARVAYQIALHTQRATIAAIAQPLAAIQRHVAQLRLALVGTDALALLDAISAEADAIQHSLPLTE